MPFTKKEIDLINDYLDGVDRDVAPLIEVFDKVLAVAMKDKFLAHLIAVMEDAGRVITKNELFRINLVPKYTLTEEEREMLSKYYLQGERKQTHKKNVERIVEVAKRIRSRTEPDIDENISFWDILYPASNHKKDDSDTIQYNRIARAHELGHLFIALSIISGQYKKYTLLKDVINTNNPSRDTDREKFCDLFAMCAIKNKNDFYLTAKDNFVHENGLEGILDVLSKYRKEQF